MHWGIYHQYHLHSWELILSVSGYSDQPLLKGKFTPIGWHANHAKFVLNCQGWIPGRVLPLCWVIWMCCRFDPLFHILGSELDLFGVLFLIHWHQNDLFEVLKLPILTEFDLFDPKFNFSLDLFGSNFQRPEAHPHRFSDRVHFPLYWPFVRGIPSPQRASLQSRGALKSFWYSVIWDAVRLMWCHCNMLSEPWAIENWYCEGPRKFDKGHLSLFTNLKWNQYISLVNEWFTQSMCCQFSLTSQNWRICKVTDVFLWRDPPEFAWALENSHNEGPRPTTKMPTTSSAILLT